MLQEREEYVRLINSNIKEILTDIVLLLDCHPSKKEQLNQALAFLANIAQLYAKQNEQILAECQASLHEIQYLYQFEVEVLVKELWERLLSQLHVFKEAYEIAVLKVDQPKYRHLKVEEPLITIIIPKPILCQPLAEALFLGEARTICCDDDHSESTLT